MTTKPLLPDNRRVLAAVHQFTQQLLAEGCNPADLSCALTTIAVRMGLDLAPSAGVAFAVVMRAASDAAAEWASSQSAEAEAEPAMILCGQTIH
jgi:hypothetical protein